MQVSFDRMMGRLSYCTSMVFVYYFLMFFLRTDSYPSECTLPFPRSYVVYHLSDREVIEVDGKLDDSAWDSVSWTEDFIGKFLIF